jgi:predicted ATPase
MTTDAGQPTRWCAITGAPSSGKTSVIDELAARGYLVHAEVARALISRDLAEGKSLSEIRDRDHVQELQRRILAGKLKAERALDPSAAVFLDRGLPDSVTYFRLADLDPAPAIDASKIFRYRAVFLMDRLPLVKDGVRTEDERQARVIESMIADDYISLGYRPVRVPVFSISARADFILEQLGLPPRAT